VKNEPGAADFYYGEMEMRRYATDSRSGERWIIKLYELISGYGLRASRAFISILVLIACACRRARRPALQSRTRPISRGRMPVPPGPALCADEITVTCLLMSSAMGPSCLVEPHGAITSQHLLTCKTKANVVAWSRA
jgi:hypothetical protein